MNGKVSKRIRIIARDISQGNETGYKRLVKSFKKGFVAPGVKLKWTTSHSTFLKNHHAI